MDGMEITQFTYFQQVIKPNQFCTNHVHFFIVAGSFSNTF
jgi:glycyl-tRNA synthetase alpha subunit